MLHIEWSKTGPRDVILTREGKRWFEHITAGRAPDALLLPNYYGEEWESQQHVRVTKRAVKLAKLPPDTALYTLRHTYASQAIMNGMHSQLLAENMGTSVKMIEDHYGKFFRQAKQHLIERSAVQLGLMASNIELMGSPKGSLSATGSPSSPQAVDVQFSD
jgi:hypothetical protein